MIEGRTQKSHVKRNVIYLGGISLTAFGLVMLWTFEGHAQNLQEGLQLAQSVERRTYDIPAGKLGTAITHFGDITGLQLLFQSDLVRGKSTAGLKGRFSDHEAIERLLAGSGLHYRFSGHKTITISKTIEGAGEVLAPLVVTSPKPGGYVDGYVAKDSLSATKTGTPLLKTPQSISVVSRDQAKNQGAQNIVQSLRYTAGVMAEVRGSSTRYDIPYIRGFGAPSDPVMYQDGLRMLRGAGYAFPQAEAYGGERVEILKGPSSTLYGLATPGGLVNVASKKPTSQERGEIDVQLGSFKRKQLAVDVSGPLTEDGSLLYRFVGLGKEGETQVVNTKEERLYAAPSLTWKDGDETSLTVLTSFQYDPEGGYYGVLPTKGTLWESSAGKIDRDFNEGDPSFSDFHRNQKSIGYEFEHHFDDMWTVQHNVRYNSVSTKTKDLLTSSLAADGHTINRYAWQTDEEAYGVASDLRVRADFASGGIEHTTIGGVDYQRSDASQKQYYGTAASIDYLAPNYNSIATPTVALFKDQDQTIRQRGVYLQDEAELGNWNFLVAGRYDFAKTQTKDNKNNSYQVQNDEAFSWKVGTLYSFDFGLSPYASYSTSFLPVSGTDSQNNALVPTTAKQFEIGIKYEPHGFDGHFTLSAFDITQENVVMTVNPMSVHQTGEVRSRGLEFEAKAALTDQTNIVAALSLIDAEVTKTVGYNKGDAPVATPDMTASFWMDHRLDDDLVKGLTIGAGVRYIGESIGGYSPNAFTAGAQTLEMPDYTLFDAAITYDLGVLDKSLEGMSARINANNLFDKTYVTCLANNFCNYGNALTVTTSLTYQW